MRTLFIAAPVTFERDAIMKKEEFMQLAKSRVIMLDGATGSNMQAAGMPKGCCTEHWIYEHKDAIQSLQRAYIDAGSDIIYAPTFGGNRLSLAKHGFADQVWTLNKSLVQYAKEVAKGRAWVAGNITTTGKIVDLDPEYSTTMAYQNYCEQLQAQLDAGVDLLVVETMISLKEALIALDACRNLCDLPVICTMSVRENGCTYYDGNVVEQVSELEQAGACAVGVNCSVSPDMLVDVIKGLKRYASVPIVAKPNIGLPKTDKHGNFVYEYNPPKYADLMAVLVDEGATIIGGCCGTTPEHIRELSRRFKQDYCTQEAI